MLRAVRSIASRAALRHISVRSSSSCSDQSRFFLQRRLSSFSTSSFSPADVVRQAEQTANSPISDEEFAQLVKSAGVCDRSRIALAVSGGPDSMALAHLFVRWQKNHPNAVLMGVTVDHALRTASATEAADVHSWFKTNGIDHEIMRVDWEEGLPSSAIQARARDRRYDLLSTVCKEKKIQVICTAHHLNDQAETFLLRLARGSGVTGLACMPQSRSLAYVVRQVALIRPFLTVPKSRLLATCEAAKLSYVIDPSNYLEEYTRVRIRRALETLQQGGDARVSAFAFAKVSELMAEYSGTIKEQVDNAIMECAVDLRGVTRMGGLAFDRRRLLAKPQFVSIRVFSAAIRTIGGRALPLRLERLSRIWAQIPTLTSPITFGGCVIIPCKKKLGKHLHHNKNNNNYSNNNSDHENDFDTLFICPETESPHHRAPSLLIRSNSAGRFSVRFDWRFVIHFHRTSKYAPTNFRLRRHYPGDRTSSGYAASLRGFRNGWPPAVQWSLPVVEFDEEDVDRNYVKDESLVWMPHIRSSCMNWKAEVVFDPLIPLM